MSSNLKKALRRFGREEDGQMVAEFALLVPLVFTLFMTAVEMGMYQIRQAHLDRGLDMTVRLVRLNTGANYTHNDLKTMICQGAGNLMDCDQNLKLEMNPVNLRNFNGFAGGADCVDRSQPVKPNRAFVHGGQHELMLLRACYKFKPVFPTSGLGKSMSAVADGAGMVKMVSVTAFVQEP